MQGDGKGWLYAPSGVLDGPLPTHYEPVESPVRNPLYGQQANPTRKMYAHPVNSVNPSPPQEHARCSRTCSLSAGSPSTTRPAG